MYTQFFRSSLPSTRNPVIPDASEVRRLHEIGAHAAVDKLGTVVLLSRRAVTGAYRDSEIFSSRVLPKATGPLAKASQIAHLNTLTTVFGLLSNTPGLLDGDTHQRARKPHVDGFRPKLVRAQLPDVNATAAKYLRLVNGTQFDLRKDLVEPFSRDLACASLGIPDEDMTYVDDLACEMFRLIESSPFSGHGLRSLPNAMGVAARLNSYFQDLVQRMSDPLRPEQPSHMLTSMLDQNGAVDESRKNDAANYLMIGYLLATETTRATITNACWYLTRNFEIQQGVRAGTIPLEYVLEETLRMAPPLAAAFRVTTRDTTIDGVDISKGTRVTLSLEGAAKDFSVYDQPWTFDPMRWANADLPKAPSFGGGSHICVGERAARMQFGVMMKPLMAQGVVLWPVGKSESRASAALNSVTSLPVLATGLDQALDMASPLSGRELARPTAALV